jgi:hypothetical protein
MLARPLRLRSTLGTVLQKPGEAHARITDEREAPVGRFGLGEQVGQKRRLTHTGGPTQTDDALAITQARDRAKTLRKLLCMKMQSRSTASPKGSKANLNAGSLMGVPPKDMQS